ncbi:Acg family FMN-binding oxidoreductase [Streptomyces sp. NPDC090493]|uniref:Acg family FMN-binding oxidoreductase n=1 Tax=Streptomyces sp. NPDC090493 TaxID=3365964 RepID=UPI0037F29A7C
MTTAYRNPYPNPGHAALHLARAASLAPSPHNIQPWFFAEEGHDRGFEVHADNGRRLLLTDPGGRQAAIAGGAALFNVRIAVRQLGFRPVVNVLPVPGRPGFLARVGFGAHAPVTRGEARMVWAMGHRRTHRGRFASGALTESLVDDLRAQARAEGAELRSVDSPDRVELLADLVGTAEDRHRADRGHAAELARCVGPWGLPAEACLGHPDLTLLAGRDYLGLAHRYTVPVRNRRAGTGSVLVLSTAGDGRADWLRAGQALQRVLLYAAARDAVAAFHTQPLEVPALRAEVRAWFTPGRFPQMVLRLGHAAPTPRPPRRPLDGLLVHESALASGR